MSNSKKVGIVGCGGAVGQEIIKVLYDLSFPIKELHLFASSRTAGTILSTPFGEKTIRLFNVQDVREMDIVFVAVSGSFSLQYIPEIIKGNGPIVIDNSSAFRYNPDVPLVIPEINGNDIGSSKIIANPNCTTAIAAMALYPIYLHYGIRKLIVSTYQAASGQGLKGMEELKESTRQAIDNKAVDNKVFAYPLSFNVIPHIDDFQSNGYTKEEMKVVWETQKIFHDDSINVSCTAVRIPTLRAHAESITLETCAATTVDDVRKILSQSPGVEVQDDPEKRSYPMPITSSTKKNIQVGRLRQSIIFNEKGLDLFVCGDQLLRGAALNAVLIAKYIADPTSIETYRAITNYPIHRIKNEERKITCYERLKHTSYVVAFGALVAGITTLLVRKR